MKYRNILPTHKKMPICNHHTIHLVVDDMIEITNININYRNVFLYIKKHKYLPICS